MEEIPDYIRERTTMRHRYPILLVLILAAALILGPVSCGSKKEPQSKLNPEVTGLVKKYQEMKTAGLKGKMAKFIHMRDSTTRMEVAKYFRRTGRVIDSAKIYQWAFNWPDVAGLPLMQDSINGHWRRLIFRQCGLTDSEGKEDCIFSVVLFGKDHDAWNVSNACKIGVRRYKDDGSEATVDDLVFNDLFLLPPSFKPLYQQQVGDSATPPPLKRIDPRTGLPMKESQDSVK
jgi:hypothetical protein